MTFVNFKPDTTWHSNGSAHIDGMVDEQIYREELETEIADFYIDYYHPEAPAAQGEVIRALDMAGITDYWFTPYGLKKQNPTVIAFSAAWCQMQTLVYILKHSSQPVYIGERLWGK